MSNKKLVMGNEIWLHYRGATKGLRSGIAHFLLALLIAHCSLLICSCSETHEHTAPAINDRDSASMMVSYGVNTLISDSGVIKYRIVTERWEVNTVRQPNRWIFEKGIFMEQFDKSFHIEGYIQADTAWYYDQQKLWELRGRVSIRNVNGLIFNSEELFWDGIRHEFYSYQFSRLVTPERTLEGTYLVGSFESSHEESDSEEQKSANSSSPTAPADSAKQDVPFRRAAIPHAATQKSNYKP